MAAAELYLDLPAAPDAPRLARSAVRARLGTALEEDRLIDLQIAVGELVSHAVTAGTGEVSLRVRMVADIVHVEVRDQGGAAAGALYRPPAADLPLRLLERVAQEVEVRGDAIVLQVLVR